MFKCAEFKFDLICEIIFDNFFPGLTGILTHAHVHHCVAMRGGRSNHSASGADKVIRVGPAWSYCHPMMYFIIYVQVEASRICVSSLRRGHANLLCIVPILVYVLLKRVLEMFL